MNRKLHSLSTKYLFTMWTIIITIGLVTALFGLQRNSNSDYDRSQLADLALSTALCHAVADNNQAIRDILSLLSVDTKITPDMTPSQRESIRIANERRKGYRIITNDLFPNPICFDGYKATSHESKLEPTLLPVPGTTVGTTHDSTN